MASRWIPPGGSGLYQFSSAVAWGAHNAVFTLVIDYLSYVTSLGIRGQNFLMISAFLTRYSLGHLVMLDLINWLSRFY